MVIPMVEVFLPNADAIVWEAVAEPINNTDKLEWFDDLKDWTSTKATVTINGHKKECDVYLCSDTRGWVRWKEFEQAAA